jgi:LysR family transcriptional regulator, nod-box dependent transcriptional activator
VDLHQFDLNLLVALDALLTEKNVTHAGMRRNLSQSAMSGALARLRNLFQDELLVPVGRRMVLTPLAQDLVQPVRNVLLQVQATIATKPRFDPATSERHFSIAVSDYVSSVLMIDLLRRLKTEAPTITFELRPIGKRANEDLESGKLDFLVAPEVYVSAVHPKEVLFEDTHTCVAWTKNRQVGTSISLEQYLRLGHVAVHVDDGGPVNYDERILRSQHYKRTIEVVTPSFDLAPQMVVGTDRIATVATRLAEKYAELLPIKLLPVPIEIPPMVEVLQWHRAHNRDPAHIWLRARLRDAVARLPDAESVSVGSTKRHSSRGRRPAVGSKPPARRAGSLRVGG